MFPRDDEGPDEIRGGSGADRCLLAEDGMDAEVINGGGGMDAYRADPLDRVLRAEDAVPVLECEPAQTPPPEG